ncbi:PAS domain S-box protein [Halobaculum rubrum]|uniref:PAS domain S-box protein n=1 Tax=Halobaculum rubrum TaxID=2872158 RepID=UPI001CA3D157|nr:PAS domain S-box protein [Halobaculum rubrum]QZX98437.1 PAS domain S-box protein [Halobaculum rubrum]
MGRRRILLAGCVLPQETNSIFGNHSLDVITRREYDEEEAALESARIDCALVRDTSTDDGRSTLATVVEAEPEVPVILCVEDGSPRNTESLPDNVVDYVRKEELETSPELVARRIKTAAGTGERSVETALSEQIETQVTLAEATFTDVSDVMADVRRDVEAKIEQVLEIGCQQFGYPLGFVTRVDSDSQEVIAAVGDHEIIQSGTTDTLSNTYCRRTIEADEPVVIDDPSEEGPEEDPAFDRFGLQCCIGAEIAFDDEVYGTLCFADNRPQDRLIGELQQSIVKTIARWIGYELERRQHEAELERQQQNLRRFKQAAENAGHAVYITDTDGTIEYVNPAFEEITGYDREDALGENPRILKSGVHDESYYDALWTTILAGDVWEEEIINNRADGEQYTGFQTIAPVFDDSGEIERFVAIQSDLSVQKQREREFRSFKQAIESSGHSIVITDTNGVIEYVNPAFEEITGYSRDEAIGATPRVLKSGEHDEAFYADLWSTILNGDVWEAELVNERADGERFVVDQTIAPVFDDDGDIERFVAVNRDITERKAYEQTLEQQRDNLEVLNQAVRHDIRNDLQLVLAYAEAVQSHVEEDGEEYIEQVLEAARDAVDITTTARDVTEMMIQSDAECRPIGLRPVLERELEDIAANHDHALVQIDGSVPAVEVLADEMLESVFRNVLTNAVQHNDKEVPEVTVSATRDDETVVIRVADNGPGISDARKSAIFDQGEMGLDSEGTGLGLYLVETLVARYGGDVQVEDNDPEGTVFVVRLQISQ